MNLRWATASDQHLSPGLFSLTLCQLTRSCECGPWNTVDKSTCLGSVLRSCSACHVHCMLSTEPGNYHTLVLAWMTQPLIRKPQTPALKRGFSQAVRGLLNWCNLVKPRVPPVILILIAGCCFAGRSLPVIAAMTATGSRSMFLGIPGITNVASGMTEAGSKFSYTVFGTHAQLSEAKALIQGRLRDIDPAGSLLEGHQVAQPIDSDRWASATGSNTRVASNRASNCGKCPTSI